MRSSTYKMLACCLSVTLVASTGHSAIVSYWGFNEGGGGSLGDSVSSNNGTLGGAGGPTWVSGHTGGGSDYSLDFGGQASNHVVNVPNSASLQTTGSMSLSLWLYPRATPLVGSGRQNPWNKAYGGEGTFTLEDGGGLNLFWGDAGADGNDYNYITAAAGTVTANNWQLITYVRDFVNDQVHWYRNGVLVLTRGPGTVTTTNGAKPWIEPAVASAAPVLIGSGYEGTFDGSIDDVALYNEPITLGEIKSVYSMSTNPNNPLLGKGYDVPDLHALWQIFDGGPGSSGIVNGYFWEYSSSLDTTGQNLGDAWGSETTFTSQTYLWLDGLNLGLLSVATIPEPSSLTLLGIGVVGYAVRVRRRRAAT